jgi:hypothetical protein
VKLDDSHRIVGIEGDPELVASESRRLYREHRDLFAERRIGQAAFRAIGALCKVMPALSGIGELGSRHYQALEYAKALVCEDVSYIETMFPFEEDRNYVRTADRLEDFEEKVRWLLRDERARRRIAAAGFRDLVATYADGDAIFERSFLRHLGISVERVPAHG